MITISQASENSAPAIQTRKSPFAYGAGNFGISILSETFNGFAYFYYVDFLGLALVSAALVRTVFAIWDAIDDPLMGFLSDHSHSRWGRRRPWLISSLPLMMATFFLVFSVPQTFKEPPRLLGYMLVILLIYETLSTMIGINYSALYPELFQTMIERARVAVFSQSGNILGLLIGLALSPLLFQALGFSAMAGIYALAGGALFFISLNFNREGLTNESRQWSDLWPTLRGILVDRVYWLYILMMILTFFSTGLIPFALPFYVKYSLHGPTSMISLLSGLALASSLVVMPLWTRLIKRWELQRVFLANVVVLGAGMLGLGLFSGIFPVALSAVFFGIALQGINVCNIVIRASLISRNIDRSGSRNEASYYGMMNSALRLGGLLQSLAMLLAGVLFGYVSGENPGPQPGAAFRFLISALPILSLVVASIFARLFFNAFVEKTIPSFRS